MIILLKMLKSCFFQGCFRTVFWVWNQKITLVFVFPNLLFIIILQIFFFYCVTTLFDDLLTLIFWVSADYCILMSPALTHKILKLQGKCQSKAQKSTQDKNKKLKIINKELPLLRKTLEGCMCDFLIRHSRDRSKTILKILTS